MAENYFDFIKLKNYFNNTEQDIYCRDAEERIFSNNHLTYDTPENHGAVGDGKTDDTEAVQAAIDSGIPVFGARDYKVTSITIPASSVVFINAISSDTNGAVKITGGAYGLISINKVVSSGDCVQFTNIKNSLIERVYFYFGELYGNGHAINFLNGDGILDSTIGGHTWQTNLDAFYISDNSEYVGQMDIKCNRIISTTGYSIYLNASAVPLTGFNFNYCSLEGTHSGIYINMSANFEPIYGNFRIRENLNNGNPMLTITSTNLNYVNMASHVHFDFLMPDQVDLSGLRDSLHAYYNQRPIFFIDGDLYTRYEFLMLAKEVAIRPTGMTYTPIANHELVLSSGTSIAEFPADKDGYNFYNSYNTTGDVTAVTLPRYWDGLSLFGLNLARETTVYMYYSVTKYISIVLGAGQHYVSCFYDLNGVPTFREL